MENIIESTPTVTSPFVVTLPVFAANGGEKTTNQAFRVAKATAKRSREYYINIRKTSRTADTADVVARIKEIAAQRAEIAAKPKSSWTDAEKAQYQAIETELNALDDLRAQSDVKFYQGRFKTCYDVLDTDLGFNQIDWDNAELEQVTGAIDFFGDSATKSAFAPSR